MPSFNIILSAALIASVSLNLAQKREVNKLRTGELLDPGTYMTHIEALTPDGTVGHISPGGFRPTILYVFSPRCQWCTQNQANIRTLAKKVADRYRVVGLSLTDRGLREYLRRSPLPFDVYTNPSADAVAAYKLQSAPQTLVVAANGRLERVWRGAYAGEQRAEVEEYFNARLPGLTAQ